MMQNATLVVGWGTPTHDYSHSPLDILQNAARARRIVELGYGYISTTAISRLRPYLDYGHTQRRNGHPHACGDEPAHAPFVTVR